MYASRLSEAGRDATREHQRNFNLHLKRLEEIRGRSVQPSAQCSAGLRSSLSRLKVMSYLESERIEAIKRDNRLLMQRLVAIAEARTDRSSPRVNALRSLNDVLRRKEEDRIRRENEAFSKRLVERDGEISKKQLEISFNESVKYKKRISRIGAVRGKLQMRKDVKGSLDSDVEDKLDPADARVRKSTKSYLRATEISPLSRTQVALSMRRTSEQPLDTKGDIAIIADSKKARRRQKTVAEMAEESRSQRVLGKPQRYNPSEMSEPQGENRGESQKKQENLVKNEGKPIKLSPVKGKSEAETEIEANKKKSMEKKQTAAIKSVASAKKSIGKAVEKPQKVAEKEAPKQISAEIATEVVSEVPKVSETAAALEENTVENPPSLQNPTVTQAELKEEAKIETGSVEQIREIAVEEEKIEEKAIESPEKSAGTVSPKPVESVPIAASDPIPIEKPLEESLILPAVTPPAVQTEQNPENPGGDAENKAEDPSKVADESLPGDEAEQGRT